MKVEKVEWLDSRAPSSGWQELGDLPTNLPSVLTVGFVAREDDESLTLVCGLDKFKEDFSGGMIIPKSAIVKRRQMR